MRIESRVTSVSWIPSEAISGPMRLPMDIGMGHYDSPPPDRISDATLDELRDGDALRFANRLAAWIEVENDRIVEAGYSGRAVVGSTTVQFGFGSMVFPGVAYPLLQAEPVVEGRIARFEQTAGGRTGAPLPHRSSNPPFLRISGPTAWTTLTLEIEAGGSVRHGVGGASPFPRHWIYDNDGLLTAKSGTIDWNEWTHVNDHRHSPWHGVQHEALIATAEAEVERKLSSQLMGAKPEIRKIRSGGHLTTQGESGDELYLVLDGVLDVEVDGTVVAQVGPGAIVGERAALEHGVRTATVQAQTVAKVAAVSASALDQGGLKEVADGHRREGG
jgi:hypothetical protein